MDEIIVSAVDKDGEAFVDIGYQGAAFYITKAQAQKLASALAESFGLLVEGQQ